MGKGTLLRRAAEHMAFLTDKAARFDEELAKREVEKADIQVSSSEVSKLGLLTGADRAQPCPESFGGRAFPLYPI